MPHDTTPYVCDISVRWSDFDSTRDRTELAIVDYAREARMNFIRATWLSRGYSAPPMTMRHIEVDFFKPLVPGTTHVSVHLHITEVSDSSYTVQHDIYDNRGDHLATLTCLIVPYDSESQRHITLEPAMQLMLTRYQEGQVPPSDTPVSSDTDDVGTDQSDDA